MQFLGNNWIVFVLVWAFFVALAIINFVKAGKAAFSFNTDGFKGAFICHVVLAGLCLLSGIPALISVIVAVSRAVQAN